MTNYKSGEIIAALDIGTSKICILIAEVVSDGKINILGRGLQDSKGMDKGGVVDLDLLIRSVQKSLNQAEELASCQVGSVCLSISGKHISCQNENGMISINNKEVTQNDLRNVIHTASSVKLPHERQILHVFPKDYSIDVQDGIKSPIGMSGMRMEAKVHMITCAYDLAENIVKSTKRCGLNVNHLVFSAIASSCSVLTDDEKDLGVCLIDIGAGTSDVVVFSGGFVEYSAVLPVAGNQVTSDIAKIFRSSVLHAESIKLDILSSDKDVLDEGFVDIPSVSSDTSRSISKKALMDVIDARYKEIFRLIHQDLCSKGLSSKILSGVVLTGGSASFSGLVNIAENYFDTPVRVGNLIGTSFNKDGLDDPKFATAAGLLSYCTGNTKDDVSFKTGNNSFVGLISRAKKWLVGEF